jgi:signal transduction histidine kinase
VDPYCLAQILVNLVGNAIKFSEPGTCVSVRVRTEAPWIRFDVIDHGRGIPEDAWERIFERFGQVEAADTRSKGGTGLGLAIAKELVIASGGSIDVESVLGIGSTFTIRLPGKPFDVNTRPSQVEQTLDC